MRIVFLLFIILIDITNAQNIPNERLADWSNVGAKPINTDNYIEHNFYEIKNKYNCSDDEAIAFILEKNKLGFNKIYFRNGIYNFSKPIILPSNTSIVGESSELTIFEFDLGGNYHLISSIGNAIKDTTFIPLTLELKTNSFKIENHNLSSGDFIYLFDEDNDKITSEWAKYSTGQIIEIESVENDLINLKSEVRRKFIKENIPRFITLNLVENISISNISIIRKDKTETQTSNIYFNYTRNAIVSCVRSYNSNFAHITIANSSNCDVTGSYFQDGFDYGGGGKAYGVMLQFAASQCLIYNNQFNHLRHSLILQAGSNGNVISYNYSKDPYWTDVTLPSNSAGDLVLHGNYPYSNLFESNTIQNIVIDDSHGQNGPFNTFFRNRAELYGIFMNPGIPSDSQNFIGNEITNSNFLMGNYFLSGNNHFEYGNNVKNKITPENTNDIGFSSLYLTQKLDYYNENNWPPIGLPNKLNEYRVESENSNNSGFLTACDYSISSITDSNKDNQFKIFPNPIRNSEYLNIVTDSIYNSIVIFDIVGSKIFESNFYQKSFKIDISNFRNGIYILNINGVVKKLVVK